VFLRLRTRLRQDLRGKKFELRQKRKASNTALHMTLYPQHVPLSRVVTTRETHARFPATDFNFSKINFLKIT
jgi:hypothetical protein